MRNIIEKILSEGIPVTRNNRGQVSWKNLSESLSEKGLEVSADALYDLNRRKDFLHELEKAKTEQLQEGPSNEDDSKLEVQELEDGSLKVSGVIEGSTLPPSSEIGKTFAAMINLNPNDWVVKTCKTRKSVWESATKGGGKQTLTANRCSVVLEPVRAANLDENAIAKIVSDYCATHGVPVSAPAKLLDDETSQDENIGVVAYFDPHLGRNCYYSETGTVTSPEMEMANHLNHFHNAARSMSLMHVKRIILNTQDLLNSDTYQSTTTAGTPQENMFSPLDLFTYVFDAMVKAISILEAVAPVKVVYTPSNHDRLSNYHLMVALSAYFNKDENVDIDLSHRNRYYIKHGKTLIGIAHGDKGRDRLCEAMSVETGASWGETAYHYFLVGHLHNASVETKKNGVVFVSMPSPSNVADQYHSENCFVTAPPAAVSMVFNKEDGMIASFMSRPATNFKPHVVEAI